MRTYPKKIEIGVATYTPSPGDRTVPRRYLLEGAESCGFLAQRGADGELIWRYFDLEASDPALTSTMWYDSPSAAWTQWGYDPTRVE